jgi:hypothetical protein
MLKSFGYFLYSVLADAEVYRIFRFPVAVDHAAIFLHSGLLEQFSGMSGAR